MRIFSAILVIIVLMLNLVPCADAHHLAEQQATNYHSAESDSHGKEETDACTPFCHCSCCAATTVAKLMSQLQTASLTAYKNDVLFYLDDSYASISLAIWQPPKLV